MTYRVALRKTEEGFRVSCLGLPGCWPQAATEAEALEDIQDAIHEYLAAVQDLNPDAEIREVRLQPDLL